MFDVADTPLPYNSILGRPALAKFMAVSHFAYNMMKMPAPWGVLTVKAIHHRHQVQGKLRDPTHLLHPYRGNKQRQYGTSVDM